MGFIQSSLNILNRILRRKNINPHLMSGCGLDFYPGPGTPFADTMRLMPGQGISIVSNELFKRALYCDTPPYLAEGCANAIVEDFKHIIRNFARRFSARKIVASANAGLDSRILIALLEHNHVDYSIITFDHRIYLSMISRHPQNCRRTWEGITLS